MFNLVSIHQLFFTIAEPPRQYVSSWKDLLAPDNGGYYFEIPANEVEWWANKPEPPNTQLE